MHKALAKINSTTLGYEDHGILTAYLHVSYEGGSGQGIGGYALDMPVEVDGKFSHRAGTAEGMQFVTGLLKSIGVDAWEKLPGQMIYVLQADEGWGARVLGVQGIGFGVDREPFLFASLWPESVSA